LPAQAVNMPTTTMMANSVTDIRFMASPSGLGLA
jgi:hypothetical protein